MSFKRDHFGIPIVDASDIEALTERFLRHLAPQTLDKPIFAPIAHIMAKLHDGDQCRFVLNQELGETKEGYKILGFFDVGRRLIGIDKSLDTNDVRFPFTVAHELGHFYLHGNIKPAALVDPKSVVISDSSRDLVTHRIDSSRPRSLMEWQANRFAAGILLPRLTVRRAVEDIQRASGLTRRLGTIWLDKQPSSARALNLMIAQISDLYRVSKAVSKYRMRELGILHVDPSTMPTAVGDLLGDALADLFGPDAA